MSMAEYKRQNAPYRVVIIDTGTYTGAKEERVVYDTIYMSKGGLTGAIREAEEYKTRDGWDYRVYDRQPDGTWKQRVEE